MEIQFLNMGFLDKFVFSMVDVGFGWLLVIGTS